MLTSTIGDAMTPSIKLKSIVSAPQSILSSCKHFSFHSFQIIRDFVDYQRTAIMAGDSGAKPDSEVTQKASVHTRSGRKVTGYHKLADYLGSSRRNSIFRRFGNLTMLNLLTLQAELLNLEAQYRSEHCDNNEADDTEGFAFCIQKLEYSGASQWKLALKVREKLNQYRKFLLCNRWL